GQRAEPQAPPLERARRERARAYERKLVERRFAATLGAAFEDEAPLQTRGAFRQPNVDLERRVVAHDLYRREHGAPRLLIEVCERLRNLGLALRRDAEAGEQSSQRGRLGLLIDCDTAAAGELPERGIALQ